MTAPDRTDTWAQQLHVLAVISNTQRYRSRYRLYQEFARRMAEAGVPLSTVELAYGERPWVITHGGPSELQLRTHAEMWHKENLVCLGVQRLLPHDWRYMAYNVGYVPGLIAHYWHGAKKHRKYVERWDILRDHQFDPYHDITYDSQGVLRWAGNKPALEREVTQYFQQRNEDSVDFDAPEGHK
jgi:hypothetical protein